MRVTDQVPDAQYTRKKKKGSPILKMFHNPGGDDCILGGGTTQSKTQFFGAWFLDTFFPAP